MGGIYRKLSPDLVLHKGVSENRGYPFGGPFKGILFYLGHNRGTPLFWEMPIIRESI